MYDRVDEFDFKKSLVAFIDVMGFKERFKNNRNECIKIIELFSEHNGGHLQNIEDGEVKTRASSMSFSDNMIVSIPVPSTNPEHNNDLHIPIMTFLNALSFFSFEALRKGFYIRGAIAYGEMYFSSRSAAGEPLMEAVLHEKKANYPRIVLAPTAISFFEKIQKFHYYGWGPDEIGQEYSLSGDKIDKTKFFDWLSFYKRRKCEGVESETQQVIAEARWRIGDDIATTSTNDPKLLSQLEWLQRYLNTEDALLA